VTLENRRQALELELRLSEESVAAARHLMAGGFQREAVSRLYYAAFYLIRAALLSEGIEPRTHHGVAQQWNLLFVHTGRVGRQYSRLLSLLGSDREGADYRAEAVFTEEDANKWLLEVEALETEVRRLLVTFLA